MKERILSLDGLKGLCCILIFFYHFVPDNSGVWVKIMDNAVALFCMMTGFGLAYSYKEKIITGEEGDGIQFFRKRYIKLMPLYWLTNGARYLLLGVGGLFLGKTLFPMNRPYNVGTIIAEFSGFYTGIFTENSPLNGPLWTICCLLLCYILFYIICRVGRKDRFVYTLLWLIVIGMGVYCFLVSPAGLFGGRVPLFGIHQMKVFANFAAGCLVFEIYGKVSKKVGKTMTLLYVIATMVIFLLLYLGKISENVLNPMNASALLLLCPTVLWCALYIKPIQIILSNPALNFLGKISMSVYMWHYLIIDICVTDIFNLQSSVWGYILVLLLTIGIATISHFFIEPLLYKGIKKE